MVLPLWFRIPHRKYVATKNKKAFELYLRRNERLEPKREREREMWSKIIWEKERE